jgi:hypothetical protein
MYALPGADISKSAPSFVNNTAFTYVPMFDIPIMVDSTSMVASATAQLGFQGDASFMVSMTAGYVNTYSKDCETVGLGGKRCSAYPNYATNYFDTLTGESLGSANLTVDGYVTSNSTFYNQSICLSSNNTGLFCSLGNAEFFATDVIVSNDWNIYSASLSGFIGLAPTSAVWAMIDVNNTGIYGYSTQFSNNTDYS